MSYTTLPDEPELIERLTNDDEKAFELLVYHYSEKMYFHAINFVKRHHLAEDMVQDVFVKIWSRRHQFKKVKQLNDYLFIVSKNMFIKEFRKQLRSTAEELPEDLLEEDFYRPDEQLELNELRQLLETGISQLPEQRKLVFDLIRNEGLTQEEAGHRLGISERTIRWHLRSAREFLKAFLVDHAGERAHYLVWFPTLFEWFITK